MSVTYLNSILIGLYSISVEGKEFLWWYKLKPLEVLSVITTAKSQILCHLTAEMTCGLKSLALADSKVNC